MGLIVRTDENMVIPNSPGTPLKHLVLMEKLEPQDRHPSGPHSKQVILHVKAQNWTGRRSREESTGTADPPAESSLSEPGWRHILISAGRVIPSLIYERMENNQSECVFLGCTERGLDRG